MQGSCKLLQGPCRGRGCSPPSSPPPPLPLHPPSSSHFWATWSIRCFASGHLAIFTKDYSHKNMTFAKFLKHFQQCKGQNFKSFHGGACWDPLASNACSCSSLAPSPRTSSVVLGLAEHFNEPNRRRHLFAAWRTKQQFIFLTQEKSRFAWLCPFTIRSQYASSACNRNALWCFKRTKEVSLL